MLRELTTADGAFAASQDADTDGIEGLTFTWRAAEIRDVLGDDAPLFAAAYGVTDDGNWEGVTILSRVATDEALAGRFGLSATEVADAAGRRARPLLLARRAERPQPARDDKALAAWNGLAIAAFADAAAALAASDPDAAARYRDGRDARRETIVDGLLGDGRRRWVGRGRTAGRSGNGVLEDYAHLADGLLALYEATFDERWFTIARGPDGSRPRALRGPGRRLLRHRRRPRAAGDPAQGRPGQRGPVGERDGGAGPAAAGGLDRRGSYRDAAERAIADGRAVRRPLPDRFAQWLRRDGPRARAGRRGRDRRRRRTIPRPRRSCASRPARLPSEPGRRPSPPIRPPASSRCSHERVAIDGRPTAYVCRGFACRLPVTDPAALAEQLTAALPALIAVTDAPDGPAGPVAPRRPRPSSCSVRVRPGWRCC